MDASMKLNRKSKIMLGTLVVLCIWSFQVNQQTKAKKARAAAEHAAAGQQATAAPAAAAQNPAVTAASVASLQMAPWGQDPYFKTENLLPPAHVRAGHALRHPGQQAAEGPALVLRGILWSGEHSSAQIGDRVVQKGEAVQGWTIVDIKQSSVTLASHGVTITLQLHEGQS